ncbi:MAG TPA: U32 family peptidase [Bacteroidales bacterium]|nr:U32 family peptidase [Bacteroidales bacterium]
MDRVTAIELLSPARDADTGIAAVNCGADAVYIAARRFGARKGAGNELHEIERLIQYAHLFRARVYLALNTLLYDSELEEALSIINDAWNAGIDGIIIQDMGLLECNLPPVPLIASTQTDNRNAEKISFLEKVGFQRVILARELSLTEIKNIRSQTSLELEFFIHGALCVSYSGQCYLSQAVKGRSANRGECAQLCRVPYSLFDENGNKLVADRHVLSLKDLNLTSYLEQLIDAGITSFKIEGRLKDIAYVKNVTTWYRKILDRIIEGRNDLKRSSSGSVFVPFNPDPARSFNRGFTAYFIRGRKPGLSAMLSPKSTGYYLGKVKSAGDGYFVLDTSESVSNGDGLCYFDEQHILRGFRVNKAEGNRIFIWKASPPPPGTEIYRNNDILFEQQVMTAKETRKIPVSFALRETKKGYSLSAVDDEGNSVLAVVESDHLPASKPAVAEKTIREQLGKTGNTIFEADTVTVDFSQPWFIQTSVINELRRQCLGFLLRERIKNYRREERFPVKNEIPYPESSLDFKANVLNKKAEAFYRRHGVHHIQPGFELKQQAGAPLMTMKFCPKFEQGKCPRFQDKSAGKGDWFLTEGENRFRLVFHCDECVVTLHKE